MLKVVIVDDESPARTVLFEMINTYFSGSFEIVGVCESVDQAVISILNQKPDLVFLDVQMPDKNGFELLKLLPERDFEVVFTTAYSEFAIKAIKYSALDYLLKPIDLEELKVLVEKLNSGRLRSTVPLVNKALFTNIENKEPNVIALPSERTIELIKVSDIVYCEAQGSYTQIYFKDGAELLVSKPLKYFIELLEEKTFLKTHKSYLVNTIHVLRYLKKEEKLAMVIGANIPIAARRKPQVLQWIKSQIN